MPPLRKAFGAGRRLGSPMVKIEVNSSPSLRSPPTDPLPTSEGKESRSKRRRNATPGPSQDDGHRSGNEKTLDEQQNVSSGSSKRRRVLQAANEEDSFPHGRRPQPHQATSTSNRGNPKMSEKERRFRWPNKVRLSLRELRFLRHAPHSVVPPRYRHEIAPYAFDEEKYRLFSEYKRVKPEPAVGSEEAECIKKAFEHGAWNGGVERAASKAREGGLSKRAIAQATEIIRQTFREQPDELERSDDEVQVVDTTFWELAALQQQHARKLRDQDNRLQRLESAIKRL